MGDPSMSQDLIDRAKRLQLIVLESPYDTWNHPLTQALFLPMIELKLKGYGRAYPYGVLAADTTDFIADHLLVCEETDQGYVPIFGNKSIPAEKCEMHYVAFPGLSLLEDSGAMRQAAVMRKIMENAKQNNVDLRYAGSMTIHPKEVGNKEWQAIMRELFTTIYVKYYRNLGREFEIITGATVRFKVPEWVKKVGHVPFEENGEVLPAVQLHHLAGEDVIWTTLKEFTFEARRIADKWESLWNNRIHVAAPAHARETGTKAA